MSEELKRYTERDEFGNADIIGVDMPELVLHLEGDQINIVTDALNRLAEYEETGLTPQAITAWNTRADGWIPVEERLPSEDEILESTERR